MCFRAIPRDLFHRLERACLVVGKHDGNESRVRSYGSTEVVRVDSAVTVHRENGHGDSQLQEKKGRVQNGRVFHGGSDDVEIPGASEVNDAFEDGVVRLASSGGKDDLFSPGVDKARNFLSCLLHPLFCPCAENIAAGRVAEFLRNDVLHVRGCAGVNRCGGVVIQVYEIFHIDFPMPPALRVPLSL